MNSALCISALDDLSTFNALTRALKDALHNIGLGGCISHSWNARIESGWRGSALRLERPSRSDCLHRWCDDVSGGQWMMGGIARDLYLAKILCSFAAWFAERLAASS